MYEMFISVDCVVYQISVGNISIICLTAPYFSMAVKKFILFYRWWEINEVCNMLINKCWFFFRPLLRTDIFSAFEYFLIVLS